MLKDSELVVPNIIKSNDTIADNTEALFCSLLKKALKKEWNNNCLTIFLVTMCDPYTNNSDIRLVKIGVNKQIGNKYSHALLLDYFRQYLFDVRYFEMDNKDLCYTISITKENLKSLIKDSKRKKL